MGYTAEERFAYNKAYYDCNREKRKESGKSKRKEKNLQDNIDELADLIEGGRDDLMGLIIQKLGMNALLKYECDHMQRELNI
jgi:hypothetical protein